MHNEGIPMAMATMVSGDIVGESGGGGGMWMVFDGRLIPR